MNNPGRVLWPLAFTFLLVWLVFLAPSQLTQLGLNAPFDEWLLTGVAILSWLVGAFLVSRLLDILLWNGIVRRTIHRDPPRLVVQLCAVAIYLAAIAGVLAFVFNQSVTAFWATSGAVGIIIGFALQNLILDTFSGLAIHLERPFKVGDWINVNTRMGEFIGRVEETNWRTTRLWTTSRNIVIVPNSFMTTTIVINFSLPNQFARFELDFMMDYFVPTERVIRVLTAAVKASIGERGPLAEPAPKVRIDDVTEEGIRYKIRYYLDPEEVSPAKARNTILEKVMQHMNHSGLSLTYPKRDIYMTQMPWRQKDWEYQKDQERQLRRLSLFKALSDENLAFLATQMKVHHCRPGQQIVSQNDEGNSMYIVGEGLLDVTIRNGEQDVLVASLEPGDFFGEASLLTGEPRSATVTCSYEAVVGEITKEALSELISRSPEVADLLSHAMARRTLTNNSVLEASIDDEDDALLSEANLILGKLKNFFRLN